jgi:hypothetical protein
MNPFSIFSCVAVLHDYARRELGKMLSILLPTFGAFPLGSKTMNSSVLPSTVTNLSLGLTKYMTFKGDRPAHMEKHPDFVAKLRE